MEQKQTSYDVNHELSSTDEFELFKLEELEQRLEMSDFTNPSPPAEPPTDGW